VPIEQFCTGYSIPAGITQRRLEAPDGALLNSAWLGSGETAAVLLHQGDGNGLCGFLFYADFLAKRGIKVALLDFCDYGQSSCLGKPIAEDRSAQVKVITDAARADGARRVALVGASLGGAVAVTAARTTKPDAIVDLSGGAKEEQSDRGGRRVCDDACDVRVFTQRPGRSGSRSCRIEVNADEEEGFPHL
jgi:pimeloyl-ACP methyl ester carboxylesterase